MNHHDFILNYVYVCVCLCACECGYPRGPQESWNDGGRFHCSLLVGGLGLHFFLSLSRVWMTSTEHCESIEGSSPLTSGCLGRRRLRVQRGLPLTHLLSQRLSLEPTRQALHSNLRRSGREQAACWEEYTLDRRRNRRPLKMFQDASGVNHLMP